MEIKITVDPGNGGSFSWRDVVREITPGLKSLAGDKRTKPSRDLDDDIESTPGFIDTFLNKTSTLGLSETGKALVDYVRILDALGISKESIMDFFLSPTMNRSLFRFLQHLRTAL